MALAFCKDAFLMAMIVWIFGTSIFVDMDGIIHVSIIATVLMRESISYSKLPETTIDESTFKIPVGIPVSVPSSDLPSSA